jgi:hypothetical protein
VDSEGKLKIKGQQWNISKALSGEWVQIVPVERRLLVFYCQTLIRELDPALQPQNCKGCLGTKCKPCLAACGASRIFDFVT